MKQRRPEVDGVLLLDKPPEWTSHDVVQKVRRILGQRSVGHCGTLDPLASGLLVILLGQATKLSDYLLTQDKTYRLRVRFGLTTDTLDRDGEILTRSEVNLSAPEIEQAMTELLGDIDLPVPVYSAVKIDGRKLYEYARAKEEIELPLRQVSFSDLQIIEVKEDYAEVEVRCSKGSYVRAWTSALGERLGCGAVLDDLRRQESFPFRVDQAVSLATLEESVGGGLSEGLGIAESLAAMAARIPGSYMGMADALPHWKGLILGGKDEKMLLNGQLSHDVYSRLIVEQKVANQSQVVRHVKLMDIAGQLRALLEIQPNRQPKIRRVFPNVPMV